MARASAEGSDSAPEAHGQTIHVRLTRGELDALDTRWRAAGFKSRSAYLRHVVRNDIGAPTTTPAMLDEFRGMKEQLAALGRNLNQTVRAINEQRKKGATFDPRNELEDDDIAGLRESVSALRGEFGEFLTGVRDRRVGGS